MIDQNELITTILASGVVVFIVIYSRALSRLPSWGSLLSAFLALYFGWILTILEGFLFPRTLNILEHLCYMLSAVLLAVWCVRFPRVERNGLW